MNKNIKQLILSNGAEIITEVIPVTDKENKMDMDLYIIKNPMLIVHGYTMNGNSTVQFVSWKSFPDLEKPIMSINISSISGIALPSDKLLEFYDKFLLNLHKKLDEPEIDESDSLDSFDSDGHSILSDSNVIPIGGKLH